MNRICICKLQLQVRERDIQGLDFLKKKTEAKIYPTMMLLTNKDTCSTMKLFSNCTRTTDYK